MECSPTVLGVRTSCTRFLMHRGCGRTKALPYRVNAYMVRVVRIFLVGTDVLGGPFVRTRVADAGRREQAPALRYRGTYIVRGVRTKSRIRGGVVSRPSKASVGVLGKAEDNAPYRMNAYMMHFVRRNM